MDIDVKNAYNRAKQAVGSAAFSDFLQDICDFILYISMNDGVDRFEAFRKIYVQKDWSPKQIKNECPAAENSLRAAGKHVSEIVMFFTILGKYYIFSKFDKKDIDKDKYADFIKRISAATIPNNHVGKDTVETHVAKTVEPKLDRAKDEETDSSSEEEVTAEPDESLEELLDKLHSLIGLDGVKEEVDQIINLIRLQKKGEEFGEKKISL